MSTDEGNETVTEPVNSNKQPRKIVIQVQGGLGANIMQVAAVKQLRKENPDAIIHVKASYPDVFKNIDFVDEYFAGPPQQIIHRAYETYKDFEFLGEALPYQDLQYRQKENHFIEAFCRKNGIGKPDNLKGEIIITDKERANTQKVVNQILQQDPNAAGKKVVAFQWTGGIPMPHQSVVNEIGRVTQARNLPKHIAQQVVDMLNNKGYTVLQISLPMEDSLNNVLRLHNDMNAQPLPIRYLFALLDMCYALISIDSFSQHAWAALNKHRGLVLWGGTSPKQLGYDTHVNITPDTTICKDLHCNRPFSFVGDFLGNGEAWECPHNEACMNYNPKAIIERFDKMIKESEDKVTKNE